MKDESRRRRAEPPPTPLDTERAERLREVLDALFEANLAAPIVVEGKKDAAALRALGFLGEIITLHRGLPLHEFCESLAESHPSVILLLDWDPTGERLMRRVGCELRGHIEGHARFREVLKALCQKEVKDVEGIPALIRRLEHGAEARAEG